MLVPYLFYRAFILFAITVRHVTSSGVLTNKWTCYNGRFFEGQEDHCPAMFTDMDFELEEDKLWVAKYHFQKISQTPISGYFLFFFLLLLFFLIFFFAKRSS